MWKFPEQAGLLCCLILTFLSEEHTHDKVTPTFSNRVQQAETTVLRVQSYLVLPAPIYPSSGWVLLIFGHTALFIWLLQENVKDTLMSF